MFIGKSLIFIEHITSKIFSVTELSYWQEWKSSNSKILYERELIGIVKGCYEMFICIFMIRYISISVLLLILNLASTPSYNWVSPISNVAYNRSNIRASIWRHHLRPDSLLPKSKFSNSTLTHSPTHQAKYISCSALWGLFTLCTTNFWQFWFLVAIFNRFCICYLITWDYSWRMKVLVPFFETPVVCVYFIWKS